MPPARCVLIAVDSVGIDPLGHNRADSVYGESRFLFPRDASGDLLALPEAPVEGALVETDVTDGQFQGAIECALTYTSIFSGKSAVGQHGLMQGLGLKDKLLESLIDQANLFSLFPDACLANAMFPAHFPFLGGSYVQASLPEITKAEVEAGLQFAGKQVKLTGQHKHGLAELFTLAEINQNIFVYAAQRAGVRLLNWDDVRAGKALTSSLTHELENQFNFDLFHLPPLPTISIETAAQRLVRLSQQHSLVFYKYQMPDLISHSGQLQLARAVFANIETLLAELLPAIDLSTTRVLVTSDHGHLEQVDYHHGHPKTLVPTWYFGPSALTTASLLRRPEHIFDFLASFPSALKPSAI